MCTVVARLLSNFNYRLIIAIYQTSSKISADQFKKRKPCPSTIFKRIMSLGNINCMGNCVDIAIKPSFLKDFYKKNVGEERRSL